MGRSHLLLDVEIGGTVYRISDDALDVDDATGGHVLAYSPGLDGLSVTAALEFLSPTAGASSVPVQCVFPADLAALRATGLTLARAQCSLALWYEGDDYSARTPLASGEASDPEYGEEGEPTAFSIERAARTSTAEVPGATEQVDGITWPAGILTLATDELGLVYPRIYGAPGNGSSIPGSQGVWIDHSKTAHAGGFYSGLELMIAGHAVTADTIRLSTDATASGFEFKVHHQLDALGRLIAFVDAYYDSDRTTWSSGTVYGLGNDVVDESFQPDSGVYKPVFCSWRYGEGLSPAAGDVISDLLQLQGFPVDYGRMAAATSMLSAYRFDCAIDARIKPMDWLSGNVLPLLPVSLRDGPDGLFLLVWRYDATREDATARVDADADPALFRAGPVREDTSEIANRFSLNYRYSVRTGAYTETLTRGTDESPDAYCLASQVEFGVIERMIDTANVYDQATGEAILAWMARAYAGARRRVAYVVPSSYALQLGDIVRLTDSRISLSDVLALVVELQIDGTGTDGVEFLLISDSLRDPLEA